MKIGVVGCGVAGQASATLLADACHDVTLFERFAKPRPLGAGLLLQPTGLAVLRVLGLDEEALTWGARIVGLEAQTRGGRAVLDLSYAHLHPKAHGLGLRRSVLFDLLHGRMKRSSAGLVTDTEIVDVENDQTRGFAIDATGARHGPFDLVVIADGAHSALRARLLPEAKARLYPWGCIWTTVADTEGLGAAGLLLQRVHGTTQMMGLLPVGPEANGIIERAAQANDFARATYRNVVLPRWNTGPVLFIGDAAHGTSPQLGQGANLGLVDAWMLAHTVAENADLLSALEQFARRRRSAVHFYSQASHLITPFFQSRLQPLGWLRDAFMGPSSRSRLIGPFMTSTLAGIRRGWLSAAPLDADGRCLLEN